MDAAKYQHGLNQTHGDLFMMLAEQFKEAYNEAISSEPDDETMEKYRDSLWEIWNTLHEPISVQFKVNQNGRTVRLKFLIEAYDSDGLPSFDDDDTSERGL